VGRTRERIRQIQNLAMAKLKMLMNEAQETGESSIVLEIPDEKRNGGG
jgi:DNA-directed RNA polymerase sigma subunit (sigma70/sigma32)